MYDDDGMDTEPTAAEEVEHATKSADPHSVTVVFSGYNVAAIEQAVIRSLHDHILKEANVAQRIRTMVEKALEEEVQTIVDARVKTELEAVLNEGWEVTDQYGARTGKRVAMKDRVSAILEKREYYNNSRSIDTFVAEQVRTTLNTHFKAETDAATKSFREQVDAFLSGKLIEGLRTALGLKG